jgi:hypothetical protein
MACLLLEYDMGRTRNPGRILLDRVSRSSAVQGGACTQFPS